MAIVLGPGSVLALHLDQQWGHGHCNFHPVLHTLKKESELSIAIPTFKRGKILLETLAQLAALAATPREILIVDQTPDYPAEEEAALVSLAQSGQIRHIRLPEPSIPRAMNVALREASGKLVLYLDDDIIPMAKLVEQHESAHQRNPGLWASVGQVVQPWQQPEMITPPRMLNGLMKDYDFPFHSTVDADIENVMAGNLCVNRQRALSIGGFDENFNGPAYRFETDFARRVVKAGGKLRFVGSAGVDHLRAKSGGTRSEGSHLKSASPIYGFGDYYYAFRNGEPMEAWIYSFKRLLREVRTRFHFTHPWWIPAKLTGEARALVLARKKARQGPVLIKQDNLI